LKSSKEKIINASVQVSAKAITTQAAKQSIPTAYAVPVAIVSQDSSSALSAPSIVDQTATMQNLSNKVSAVKVPIKISRTDMDDIFSMEMTEASRRMKRSLPLVTKNTDPAKCLDQIDRMYNIYYDLEETFSPKPYMNIQKEITIRMRSILVDWLVEVHHKFKLHASTL